jgi:hypothetical protein
MVMLVMVVMIMGVVVRVPMVVIVSMESAHVVTPLPVLVK